MSEEVKNEEVKNEEGKIQSLTPEQEALIPIYREKYRQMGLSTEPTDRAEAERAIIDSYHYQKMATPKVVWAEDPYVGALMAAQYAKGSVDVTDAEIREQAQKASYGSFNSQWVVFYAYIAEVLPVPKDNLIEIVQRIIQHCGVYWTFEGLVVLSPKPTAIYMKDEKLHRLDGPALEYATGRGVYAVDGEIKDSLMKVAMSRYFGENAKNEYTEKDLPTKINPST